MDFRLPADLHAAWAAGRALAERALAWVFPDGVDGLGLVLLTIGAQVLLLALLLAYALALRLRWGLAQRRRAKLYNVWHYLVPAYLSDEIDLEFVQHSLQRRDYALFGDFLRPYLADVAGEDAARLSGLLTRLGFKKYLRRLLRHRNRWRRAYAVHFCGLIGDPALAPLVRRALNDRADVVVYQAAEALMRLQDFESIAVVLARMRVLSRANRERIGVYLIEFGVQIVPFLRERLRSPGDPPWLTVLVLQALVFHFCVPATWDILFLYLNTGDRELRIACAKALASLGEPTLLGFFEDMLHNPDPVIQAEAARAVGTMGEREHARALAGLLASEDFWLLKRAVGALARLGLLDEVQRSPHYGAERFSPRAWELIREEEADRALERLREQVA